MTRDDASDEKWFQCQSIRPCLAGKRIDIRVDNLFLRFYFIGNGIQENGIRWTSTWLLDGDCEAFVTNEAGLLMYLLIEAK
ncbi:hypothetical protein WM40_02830 [Robbsia andropogonis]|uniref:Uncharacterized protein n=1 Tax=Robbsia andropogonis TaxID=28092 RepID=A0A0F5K4Y2_9BURK|nr:hypothetical protein WM40_02830 [Robbsia andropogonis]